MKHLDLFSGIGGFALATEMVWENVEHVFCDNDPFSQKILEKHWPNAPIYGDIRTLTADTDTGRVQRHKRTGAKEGAVARGSESWEQNWLEVATRLCTVDDGIQGGLARPRGWRNAALKGAGNAIVPQVAAEIMRGIKEIDER